MDDNVGVNIKKIENGYLVDRHWCEKKKSKDDSNGYEGMTDYKDEQFYIEKIPAELEKFFKPEPLKGKFGEDSIKDIADAMTKKKKVKYVESDDDMEDEKKPVKGKGLFGRRG